MAIELIYPESPVSDRLYQIGNNWYEYDSFLGKWMYHTLSLTQAQSITTATLPENDENLNGRAFILSADHELTAWQNHLAVDLGTDWKFIAPEDLSGGIRVLQTGARIFWNGSNWYYPEILPKLLTGYQAVVNAGQEFIMAEETIYPESDKISITLNGSTNKSASHSLKVYKDNVLTKEINNIVTDNFRSVSTILEVTRYADVDLKVVATPDTSCVYQVDSIFIN